MNFRVKTMSPLLRRPLFSLVCAVASCCRILVAQEADPPVSPDAEGQKAWNAFYQADAEEAYRFSLDADKAALKLDPTPILRWTNPLEGGSIHGVVYVWRKDGRPVVVGQLFSYLNGQGGRVYCHALHSLARRDEKLTGTRNEKVIWTPAPPGVDLKDVPDAAPPAQNRALRLTQMKAIARRFTAYTVEPARGKRILRLLPTPLDRYPESQPPGRDGALFSLAVGNDPEVLLVIESTDPAVEGAVWQYGVARSTRSTSVVQLDDREVWSHEADPTAPNDSRSGYLSVHGIAVLPLEAPARSSP